MMLVWSGKGWVVPLSFFGCDLAAALITNGLVGSEEYWDQNRWPIGVAAFAAAGICAYIDGKQKPESSDALQIPYSPVESPQPKGSIGSFFFVPFRYWPTILSVLGFYAFAIDLGWVTEPFQSSP